MDAPMAACKPGFLDVCELPRPTVDLSLAGTELNTDNDNRCMTFAQPDGPDVCLLYFRKVVLSAGTLLAYGSRPFALVASESMIIAGTVDVSSRRSRLGQPGAGAAPAGRCSFLTQPTRSNNGSGGGAGGTLGTQGGAGGTGNLDGNDSPGGAPGAVVTELDELRGGCHGQEGAYGANMPGGGLGLGGGAVYLAAPSLQLTGSVLAGGSGGGTSQDDDGGGGGGSGGVIVIESASLNVSGRLIATGGGGGEGGADNAGGIAGEDADDDQPAAGGAGVSDGGNGGAGATTEDGSRGVDNNGGAGGGGGGAGLILLLSSALETGDSTIVPEHKTTR